MNHSALESVEHAGRIVMIGCGSIGQVVLPLLNRHIRTAPNSVIVLSADERGRGIAQAVGARFVDVYQRVLGHA